MLAFCRAEYGAVDLWRGRWSDAERMLEASLEDFAASRPAWVGAPLVLLAELKRRRGLTDEARTLLDRAGPSGGAQLCRGRLALDAGETQQAADLAERLLRQLPTARALDRFPALELLVHARIGNGDLGEASVALAALRDVARVVDTESLRAVADRAEGMLAAASCEHDRARVLLEDAVDRFERGGAPYEAAQAQIELARTLVALGRADAAGHQATTAAETLERLGAATEAAGARQLLGAGGPLEDLTAREREVLRLLAEGLTNRQIAARLVVSEHTVHRHVSNILRKLGLPSRAAAAALAAQAGLLE